MDGGTAVLTQKVLNLMVREPSEPLAAAVWVEQVVVDRIIEHWESQDVPPHLKTIRDRLLQTDERGRGRLLGLYQQVLEGDGMAADESLEQLQLRLTGLVVKRRDRLVVYNPIYARVFNADWVSGELAKLRPAFYGEALKAWQEAAGEQRESFWLRGQALEEAEAWAQGKRLSDVDEQFLRESREFEKQEVQRKLVAEEEANQILTQAREQAETELGEANQELAKVKQKVKWQKLIGVTIVTASIPSALLFGQELINKSQRYEYERIVDLAGNLAENSGRLFESTQTGALTGMIAAGEQIEIARYPKVLDQRINDNNTKIKSVKKTTDALREVLKKIQERKIQAHQDIVSSITWIDDEQILVSGGEDGTIKFWNKVGELIEQPDGQPITLPVSTMGKSKINSLAWDKEKKILQLVEMMVIFNYVI